MNYEELIKLSNSKSEFARLLGYQYYNGRTSKVVNKIIEENHLNISHFTSCSEVGGQNIKYEYVDKECPVCKKIFKTQNGKDTEKTTCSRSCSNKFFVSKRVPNSKLKKYTTICFRHHKKICVVCGEENIVTVHHYDENNKNNSPENLIPLCPTHHQYWHSKYKMLVYDKVLKYRTEFIKKQNDIHHSVA